VGETALFLLWKERTNESGKKPRSASEKEKEVQKRCCYGSKKESSVEGKSFPSMLRRLPRIDNKKTTKVKRTRAALNLPAKAKGLKEEEIAHR